MFYMPFEYQALRFLAMLGFSGADIFGPKMPVESKFGKQRNRRSRRSKRRKFSERKHIIKLNRRKIKKKSQQINRKRAA